MNQTHSGMVVVVQLLVIVLPYLEHHGSTVHLTEHYGCGMIMASYGYGTAQMQRYSPVCLTHRCNSHYTRVIVNSSVNKPMHLRSTLR